MKNKHTSLTKGLNKAQANVVSKMLQKQEEYYKGKKLYGPYYCTSSGEYVTVDGASDPDYEPCVTFNTIDRATNADYIKYVYNPKTEVYFKLIPIQEVYGPNTDDLVRKFKKNTKGCVTVIDVKSIPDWIIKELFKREPIIYDPREDPIGPFGKFVFPIIRASYPKLISSQLVSVQPMTAPVSQVFYNKCLYGATKGKVNDNSK
jgi:hypothetical protein